MKNRPFLFFSKVDIPSCQTVPSTCFTHRKMFIKVVCPLSLSLPQCHCHHFTHDKFIAQGAHTIGKNLERHSQTFWR